MIVAERKPFEEIFDSVSRCRRVLVLGCGGCVSVCLTGGERQAEMLATQIRLAARKQGREMTVDFDCITRQCDLEFIGNLKKNPREYDAVLSIACGVGPQFLSEHIEGVPILAGMNTTFLAANTAGGVWEEYCHGCGDCVLNWTGGICPIARCAKGLISGICGGTKDGKCEVDPNMPCGWYLIYQRLRDQGLLEQLKSPRPPRDWRKDRGHGVRRLVLKEMVEEEPGNE